MTTFLSDIVLAGANDIQFKNTSGANTGKIESDGNNLVLSNAVGDILLGDGASDIYIGDGTNNVDILFEQSGSIKAEDGSSGVTLTLGSSDTTLSLTNPTITGTITDSTSSLAFLAGAQTFTGQKFFDAGFDAHPIMLSGSQNFDNIDRSGFYNLYNTASGSTNAPPGAAYGTMIAIGNDKGSQGFGMQLFHQRTGGAGQLQVRGMNDSGNTWTSWNTVYTASDTAAVANSASTIATGDQIYDFVIGLGYLPKAGGTMSGAIAMGSQNITGAGTITGTTLTGTSLDINGNADISGNLTGVDTLTATTLSVTNYGLASADIPNNTANTSGSSGSCTGNAASVTNGVYTNTTQTITGAKTFSGGIGGSNSLMTSFFLPQNPEGSHVKAPWFFNDMAYARLRGATVTVTVNGGSSPNTSNIDAMLDASTGFWNMSTSGVTSVVVEITNPPKTMYHGAHYGVTFGNTTWRANSVDIHAYYSGAYQEVVSITGNSKEFIYGAKNSSGNAVSKIKWTFSDFNTTSMRIVSLFAYNYNAVGMPSLYLTKDGGEMFGAIDMNSQNITDAGTITGTTLTGTSLDINGSADISGDLTGVDNLTATTLNITNYGLASGDIPNNAADTTGSAAQATNLNATDDRDMAPEDYGYTNDFRIFFTSKEGLEDGTSTGSNWQDALYINSYTDASGGDANVLAFDKSEKKIYHYQADQAATNWGTAKQLAYTDSDISGDTTGNAATATTLATARTIAGVSFNGSANISLNNNAITNGAGYTGDQSQSDINALAITTVGTISEGEWRGTRISTVYQHQRQTFDFKGYSTHDGTNYEIPQAMTDTNAPFEHNTSVGSAGTTAISVSLLLRAGGQVMPYAGTIKKWTGWAAGSGSGTINLALFRYRPDTGNSSAQSLVLIDDQALTAAGAQTVVTIEQTSFTNGDIAAGDIIMTGIKGVSSKTTYFTSTMEIEWD